MNTRDNNMNGAARVKANEQPDIRAILAALTNPEKYVDWNHQDPDITYSGKRIVLPDEPSKMSTREAADLLYRKAEDEETELDVSEVIEAFPLDGAVAFVKAMKELYGWASPIPTMSFFGPRPPKLVTVQVGPETGDYVQVPWGQFTVPGIENNITIGSRNTEFGPVFVAYGLVKKREQFVLRELANKAREIIRTSSIYKGKAIRLRVQDDGKLNPETPPMFLSTKNIQPLELILNDDEAAQVQASLWSPIQKTEKCREYGIPLKRGVLLEGPYGGGKTLVANVTSKIAQDHNWTFILLDDIRALKDALLFAQRYAPAVVFAEDADRVANVRDQRGNDLLNTIDGILSKGAEVITVLTTNHVEKLERAMLRPGRLDAVISISPPGKEAVQRLVRLYARGLLSYQEDLSEVGEVLAGNIAATVREVVERSKLAMIGRGDDRLIASDLITSAKGMKRHLELLNVQPVIVSPAEKLGAALVEVLKPELSGGNDIGVIVNAMTKLTDSLDINVMGNVLATKELVQNINAGGNAMEKKLILINANIDKIKNHLDA